MEFACLSHAAFREISSEDNWCVALRPENAVTCNHTLNLEASQLYVAGSIIDCLPRVFGVEEVFFESVFGFLSLRLMLQEELLYSFRECEFAFSAHDVSGEAVVA